MDKQKCLDRIALLEQKIAKAGINADQKEKCISTTMIIGCVMPLILGFGLYLANPAFLQKKDGEGKTRDYTKFFMTLGGLTLLSWGGLYAYSCYGGGGEVCAK